MADAPVGATSIEQKMAGISAADLAAWTSVARTYGLPTITPYGPRPAIVGGDVHQERGSVALAVGQRDRAGRRPQAGGGRKSLLKPFALSRQAGVAAPPTLPRLPTFGLRRRRSSALTRSIKPRRRRRLRR